MVPVLSARFVVIATVCAIAFATGWALSPAAPMIAADGPAASDDWSLPPIAVDGIPDIIPRLRDSAEVGAPPAAEAAKSAAPLTPPDWRIVAVTIAGDEKVVFLRTGKERPVELKIGDALPGGARIVDIAADHLIIALDGRRLRLAVND
jgi:hypothetical protein